MSVSGGVYHQVENPEIGDFFACHGITKNTMAKRMASLNSVCPIDAITISNDKLIVVGGCYGCFGWRVENFENRKYVRVQWNNQESHVEMDEIFGFSMSNKCNKSLERCANCSWGFCSHAQVLRRSQAQ